MDSRRMCPHCRAFITDKDRTCPYCNEPVGRRAVERRSDAPLLGGFIPHARFTTVMILLVNFGLYLACVVLSMKSGRGDAMALDPETLYIFGAKYRIFETGEWWRLVTAGFLHGGLMHILFNSWALFDVGAQVDEIYGTSRMLVIYIVSSVCGFFLSAVWSGTLSMGASAGICGLIGAMIALGVRHRNPMGDAIRGVYVRWAIYILIMGLLPFFNIDNAAHIGGLAGGFGIGYIASVPRYEGAPVEKVWRVAGWLCVILTIVSFLKLYLWFVHSA